MRVCCIVLLIVSGSVPALAQSNARNSGGTITGILGYPSDYVPPDMTVCAEEASTKRTHCNAKKRRVKVGMADTYSYALTVPAGRYHVYARTKERPGYRAYWSDSARCGNQAGCGSHKPIIIIVKPGATLKGIRPDDWYAD
jgi:hypothetical protein